MEILLMTLKRNNTNRGVGLAITTAAADADSTPTEFQMDSSNQRKFHHASIISDLTLKHATRYQCKNTQDDDRRQKKNRLLIYCLQPPPTCSANSPLFPAFLELGKDDDDDDDDEEEKERISLYQSITTTTPYRILPQIRQTRLQCRSPLVDKILAILTDVRHSIYCSSRKRQIQRKFDSFCHTIIIL